jgi:antitoxin YefM
MQAISFPKLRDNLTGTMERICDAHDVVIVTRENARSTVMMSLEDYNSIEKTAHLYEQGKPKDTPIQV